MTERGSITVAVLGGNSVVGRALGQLLRGADFEVRLLEEPEAFRPQELLEGVDLLLFMPYLDKTFCEDFLIAIRCTPETARVPVLALSSIGEEVPPSREKMSVVPWPCELEELARRIEAAKQAAAERGAATPRRRRAVSRQNASLGREPR